MASRSPPLSKRGRREDDDDDSHHSKKLEKGKVSVFWTGKPTKGVPEVVDCAVRIVTG
jgi:hypothetical protein